MKHSVAVKFIAIVLCAAALLGVVASGAGIAVLTNLDLYQKNPAQVRSETIQEYGRSVGTLAAKRFASQTLGGCPDGLLNLQGLFTPNRFREQYYGFTLKDAEGNEVLSQGVGTDAGTETFHISGITGKYLYLVSEAPVDHPAASEDTVIPCTDIYTGSGGAQMTEEGEKYQLYHPSADQMDPSASHFVSIVLTPENTTDEVLYASMDDTVATVDQNGLITAVGNGITAIRITCGPHYVDFPVSCQLAEPTEETLAETQPETQPTEEFVYNAWSDEDWERIQNWIEEEWSKDTWTNDKWDDLAAWAADNWNEDEWNDDQWAQLRHWIKTEWDQPETARVMEAAVPETTEPTVPETEPTVAETIDLKALEEESLKKAAELETIPEEITVNGRPVTDYQLYRCTYYDGARQEDMIAEYVMLDMPEYTMELRLLPGACSEDAAMPLLEFLYLNRSMMVPVLIVCLLVFAGLAVYLVAAAGHKPGTEEVRAAGLNRVPLELYFAVLVVAVVLVAALVVETAMYSLDTFPLSLYLPMAAGSAYLCCLLAVGFLFAVAAQFKTSDHFWFYNSVLGRCWKLLLWLWHRITGLFPTFGRWLKAGWNWMAGLLRFAYVRFARLFAMLPMVWQWLIIGFCMLLVPIIAVASESGFLLALAILTDLTTILYGAYAFGRLLDGTKRMSQGDLDTRIEDKHLCGGFRVFAQNLNTLAGVTKTAALKQLKSERMKTELITNVSHDIKTPLTSIVSYVDLLQKPHTPEEEAQYLEVLSRQSLQLKKLIEDLIEMSKASTGNMAVDIQLVDAVESVNQALGEFADKLDRAALTPVFRHDADTVPMMADGRLTWRVLHNILSNAVKYALPGTRLYIDLMEVEGKVILSMKNVSRSELNVDADELMERFVRGDDSRNTEGSGLGLNIAKSMMELQKGQLQLLIDGDLFKVTLIFPGVV